jgi:ComF family protein
LPAFDALRSPYLYAGAARSAVLALKFRGVSACASSLAAPMAALLDGWAPDVEAVVPVPLSGMRRRLRGYDQAELLAREVSRSGGIPLDARLLRRSKDVPPQARQADADSRHRNIAGAFTAVRPCAKGVLLVDDVATTGSTLDACARALKDAGAERVYCLTFARED